MCKTLGKSGRSTQIIMKMLKAPYMIFRYEGTGYWYTLVIVWKGCAQFLIIQLWDLGYLIFSNISLRLQALIGLPFAYSAPTEQLLYLFSFPKYFHMSCHQSVISGTLKLLGVCNTILFMLKILFCLLCFEGKRNTCQLN